MAEALLRAGLIDRVPTDVINSTPVEDVWTSRRRLGGATVRVHRPTAEVEAVIREELRSSRADLPSDTVAGAGATPDGVTTEEVAGAGESALVHLSWTADWAQYDAHISSVGERDVDVAISVESRRTEVPPGFIALCRRLAELGAAAGGHAVLAVPEAVEGLASVDALAGFLLAEDRVLPVVLISAFTRRSGEFALDPRELASLTPAVAHVITVPQWTDTFRLSEHLAKLGCYAGGVRLYWPRMTRNDLLEEHPLFFPAGISAGTPGQLALRIHQRAAARFRPPPRARDLAVHHAREEAIRVAGRAARASVTVRLGEDHRAADGAVTITPAQAAQFEPPAHAGASGPADPAAAPDASTVAAEASSLADRVGALQLQVIERVDLIEALTQRTRELEAQMLELRTRLAMREDSYSGVEVALPQPTSIEEAVILADDYFVGLLVVTDNAQRSASRMNSADNSPNKLWKAFCDLARVVRRWKGDDLPGGFQPALRELGWDPHSISPVTIGEHPTDYCFLHDGVIVPLEFSIQLSRGERLYWARAEASRVFVINHIGAHLPDSTTG